MSRKLMPLGVLFLTILMQSCQTPIIKAEPEGKSVPCVSLRTISYHAPKDRNDVIAWLKGDVHTGNFDTPDTVSQIRGQNAAIKAVCGAAKDG